MSELESVVARFYRHVEERPDEEYLIQPLGNDQVDRFSYARVMDEARRMAGYLGSLNLPPQSKIAIVSKNCAHFFLADLAIWMAGHVSVALYPTLTPDIVSYILEHSEARLLFVGKLDVWDQIKKGVPAELPCVAFPLAPDTNHRKWNDVIAEHEPISEPRVPELDDQSLIIYTSGSTGRPKGVVHTFRSISAPTRSLVELLSVNPSDRMLSYLPLAHAMDRWISECVSLWVGMRIYFAERIDTFVADLQRARPTLFLSVPRLWLKFQLGVFDKMPEKKLNRLLKIPIVSSIVKRKIRATLGLDQVRFAGSGSAPIPGPLLAWYRGLGLELLEGYGMSENFNYSHLTMPGRGRPGYIGHAYADVEARISEEGEIQVKSPGNMLGYYKQPELTAEVFTEDGFLRTGDRGEVDEEGRLRITGRIKELFKTSKGKYVAPVPIENLLNADSHVELSCVAGASQPATHAVIQLSETLLPTLDRPGVRERITKALEQLLARTNDELPNYEQMQFLVVAKTPWTVEDGQLTPTMKLKRSVIEEQYQPKLESWYQSRSRIIWEE